MRRKPVQWHRWTSASCCRRCLNHDSYIVASRRVISRRVACRVSPLPAAMEDGSHSRHPLYTNCSALQGRLGQLAGVAWSAAKESLTRAGRVRLSAWARVSCFVLLLGLLASSLAGRGEVLPPRSVPVARANTDSQFIKDSIKWLCALTSWTCW